ncbi:hypothetical protein IWQ62_001465 [Dispira parvispora]|uniref:Uncharacterized protein n=1 Tax=Dispira parvispora TaxID=1520584 RepID=A0A9W8ASA4_9FUNG|nr:hypothetical protein IWQ62_001465 [Dispira parvispora]
MALSRPMTWLKLLFVIAAFITTCLATISVPITSEEFRAYDFYGQTKQSYISVSAPLLPLPVQGPDCTVSLTTVDGTAITTPEWNPNITKVMAFVNWSEMHKAQCTSIAQPYVQDGLALIVVSKDAEASLQTQADAFLTSKEPELVVVIQDPGPWNTLLLSAGFSVLRWLPFALELLLTLYSLAYVVFKFRNIRTRPPLTYLWVWLATALWLVCESMNPPGWPAFPVCTVFACIGYCIFSAVLLAVSLDWFQRVIHTVEPDHRLKPYGKGTRFFLAGFGIVCVLGFWLSTVLWTVGYNYDGSATYIIQYIASSLSMYFLPVLCLAVVIILGPITFAFTPSKNYFESSAHSIAAITRRVCFYVLQATLVGGLGHFVYLCLLQFQTSSSNRITQFVVACVARSLTTVIFAVLWVLILLKMDHRRQLMQGSTRQRGNSDTSTRPLTRRDRGSTGGWSFGSATLGKPSLENKKTRPSRESKPLPNLRKSTMSTTSSVLGRLVGNRESMVDPSLHHISSPIPKSNSGLEHYMITPVPPVPPIPFSTPVPEAPQPVYSTQPNPRGSIIQFPSYSDDRSTYNSVLDSYYRVSGFGANTSTGNGIHYTQINASPVVPPTMIHAEGKPPMSKEKSDNHLRKYKPNKRLPPLPTVYV